MVSNRIIGRIALGAVLTAAVLAGGATSGAAADRAIGIAITDTDNVSPSVSGTHYMHNTVTVTNMGGSTLTNLKVRLVLTDRFDAATPPTTLPSTADYVESQSTPLCAESASASNELTCAAPNLAAGQPVTFAPLVFRTSNSDGVVATTMTVEVAANEGGNDQPSPRDPTSEQASASEETLLEGDANAQRSWVFPGASVALSTTKDGQYSTFPVNVPGTFGGALVAHLTEGPVSPMFCAGCFGEQVTTVATGIFSDTHIVELQTVVPLALVPRGVTEKGLTVLHQPDEGAAEHITARCRGEIDSGTPRLSELSCARVAIDKKLGTLTIEAFSNRGNGQWGFF